MEINRNELQKEKTQDYQAMYCIALKHIQNNQF